MSTGDCDHKVPFSFSNFERIEMEPLISVVIPVYNVESWLSDCLDSVINNTYRNLEIICVDDDSSDASLSILKRYMREDPRIKVLTKEHSGLSDTRNCGLEAAEGDYIAFIDSDDSVHMRFFELLLEASLKNEADFVLCRYDIFTFDYRDTAVDRQFHELWKSYQGPAVIEKKNINYVWGRLYSRRLIGKRRFDTSLIFEDEPFNYDVLLQREDYTSVFLDLPLYHYRRRPGSLSVKAPAAGYVQLANRIIEILPSVKNGREKAILQERIIRLFLHYRYITQFESGTAERNRQVKKDLKPLIRSMKKNPSARKEKVFVFFLLMNAPLLYKLIMACKDKSLMRWEYLHLRNKWKKNRRS